jgi:hypothetical protein
VVANDGSNHLLSKNKTKATKELTVAIAGSKLNHILSGYGPKSQLSQLLCSQDISQITYSLQSKAIKGSAAVPIDKHIGLHTL